MLSSSSSHWKDTPRAGNVLPLSAVLPRPLQKNNNLKATKACVLRWACRCRGGVDLCVHIIDFGSVPLPWYSTLHCSTIGGCRFLCPQFLDNVLALKTLLLSQQLLKFALGQRNFLRGHRGANTAHPNDSKCTVPVRFLKFCLGEGVMLLSSRGTEIESISDASYYGFHSIYNQSNIFISTPKAM